MTEFIPGEVYVDANGKFWRVKTYIPEPVVTFEEVEPSGHTSDPPMVDLMAAQNAVNNRIGMVRGSFIRKNITDGVSSKLFADFRRIWRPGT